MKKLLFIMLGLMILSVSLYGETGEASHYWQGQITASGRLFDRNAMTGAHRTLPMGTVVKVTNLANGKSVIITINDRGPYAKASKSSKYRGNMRVIDLSEGAFLKIASKKQGVTDVSIEVLSRGNWKYKKY